MNFVTALHIAQEVFEQYRVDYPKFWRRMDGTPILNDIAVRMAQAFADRDAELMALLEDIAANSLAPAHRKRLDAYIVEDGK